MMEKRISFWHRVINLIAPEACMVCGNRLGIDEEVVCAPCNLHLPRTGFASIAYDNVMARRFWGKIPIERASALFFYEAGSEVSHIIHNLKYHNHPEVGVVLGRMAAEEMAHFDFFDGIDIIMPVPLERKHQRQRGYNQSMEIARGVSEATHLPIVSNAVERTTFHGSQTQKSVAQRVDNVEGAFRLTGKVDLSHRHILVIDDIVTSGATICSCVAPMLSIPGLKVSVFSLGVVR